jgi:hypothetical protein
VTFSGRSAVEVDAAEVEVDATIVVETGSISFVVVADSRAGGGGVEAFGVPNDSKPVNFSLPTSINSSNFDGLFLNLPPFGGEGDNIA